MRDSAQVDALVAKTLERFGQIDFLINNAGGQFPARPFDISDNGWRSVIDLNLNGTWNVTSASRGTWSTRGFGSIVNIVHIYSFERGAPPFVHSGAARAGVVSMTRSLAYYWARKGVTINSLAPGTIATQACARRSSRTPTMPDYENRRCVTFPRTGSAKRDEVAAICAFLCSPAARYINGAATHRRRRLLHGQLDADARSGGLTGHTRRCDGHTGRCDGSAHGIEDFLRHRVDLLHHVRAEREIGGGRESPATAPRA